MAREVLTLEETARVLRVSRAKAYTMARDGRIPVVVLGPRSRRVLRSELLRHLSEKQPA